MLGTTMIDGMQYHTDDDGLLLLDEYNEPILSYICICAAHGAHECVCGAWDRKIEGYDWSNDDGC